MTVDKPLSILSRIMINQAVVRDKIRDSYDHDAEAQCHSNNTFNNDITLIRPQDCLQQQWN